MKKLILIALLAVSPVLLPCAARAGVIELSAGFFFNKNDYGGGDFEWNRRWTGSVGYHFWSLSEIEFSYEDSVDRTMIAGYEDTTFHDQITTLDWVQSLAPKDALFQPFVKIGIGQHNQSATGMDYYLGSAPPAEVDSVVVPVGIGLRIRVSRAIGLRAEVTSYLTNGEIATYQENVSATGGISIYF